MGMDVFLEIALVVATGTVSGVLTAWLVLRMNLSASPTKKAGRIDLGVRSHQLDTRRRGLS